MKIAYILGVLALTLSTTGNCSNNFSGSEESDSSATNIRTVNLLQTYLDARKDITNIQERMKSETLESDILRINEVLHRVKKAEDSYNIQYPAPLEVALGQDPVATMLNYCNMMITLDKRIERATIRSIILNYIERCY
jgi:hypothetical protein